MVLRVCVCVCTPKKSICRFVYDMNVDLVCVYGIHRTATQGAQTLKRTTKRTRERVERAGTFHDSTFQPTVILWFVIAIWLSFRIRCVYVAALLLYFICVAWMSTDHFVFVPKIFMVVSLLLLPLMLSLAELSASMSVCVCVYGQWSFRLAFFPFLPTNIFNGYTSWERERERGMIKCAFKVSPKYGCLCPNRYEWKVQNSYLCTSVLNYIYCISLWGLPSHPPALFLPPTRIMYGARRKKTRTFAILSALHRREWLRLFCVTHSIYCAVGRFSWHDTLSRTKYTK